MMDSYFSPPHFKLNKGNMLYITCFPVGVDCWVPSRVIISFYWPNPNTGIPDIITICPPPIRFNNI